MSYYKIMERTLTMTFFLVEADPLFHNNGNFDYNLKSSYSVISKFKLKCPMGVPRKDVILV